MGGAVNPEELVDEIIDTLESMSSEEAQAWADELMQILQGR